MNFERKDGEPDQMRCASYLRFASDMAGQVALEDQKQHCRNFAEERGWIVADEQVFELANKAYLYLTQNAAERADLLRKLCSNFSVDAVTATPACRYPFNVIFERAKTEKWSGREDSNLRPPGPEPGALPDCATPRMCAAVRCR
jgi:hypothetical protein